MVKIKIFFSILLLLAVMVFVVQNMGTVELTLLAWTVALPRALMVFSVLLVGVVLGSLWHGQARHR